MNVSNRTLFGVITVILSCVIIFSVPDPIHMNIIRTALLIMLADFIAVSKYTRWISLETASLILFAASLTIAIAGYIGKTDLFLKAGVMLTAITLILLAIGYLAPPLYHSMPRKKI